MGFAAALATSSMSILESLKNLGFVGRVCYMLGLSIWVVFCGPTTPVELASGFVFRPVWMSTMMCTLGKTFGNLIAFVLGRRLLKPLVMRLLQKAESSRAVHNHLLSELRERPIQTMSIMRAAPLPTPFKLYGLCLFPAELVPIGTYAVIAFTFNTCWSVVWSLAGSSASSLQDVMSGKGGENSHAALLTQVLTLLVLFYALSQFARFAKAKMTPPANSKLPADAEADSKAPRRSTRRSTTPPRAVRAH